MAPRSSVEDRIRSLRSIRDNGDLGQLRDAVTKSLGDASNLVVAEAAELVVQFELTGLEPLLLAAWTRLFEHKDPVKADRCCTAKSAIIEALRKLGYDDPDFFLVSIKYEQMEPAWGGAVDTAENVRGSSAFALVRSQRLRIVDKLIALVDLLQGTRLDRIHAIKAMINTGSESAIPLLRMKLMSGDVEPEVVGCCMTGLLELAPTSSLPLVVGFLKNEDENIVLEAAAALGSFGSPDAVAALIAAWKRTGNTDLRRSLLLSIGLSRHQSAIDFLLVRLESTNDVEAALEALKPACVYEEIRIRIRKVLEKNGDPQLILAFTRKFE